MTWNPLRRNCLTTKPSPAHPAINRANERELEVIFIKLQQTEETTKKLQKEMKKYMDAVANSSKAEQKISADLSSSAVCYQHAELRRIVEDYHSVTSQVAESVQELSQVCQRTFQEPMKKYNGLFNGVDAALHRREQLVQEWRNLTVRVRKLEERERTAANIVKLEKERRTLEAATAELLGCHDSLVSELNQFLDKRTDYLSPSLQALVRSQLEYYGNTTRLFTHLYPVKGDSPSSAMLSDTEYQNRIQAKLGQIRALSIVKNNTCSA